MQDFFLKRTKAHIARVKQNIAHETPDLMSELDIVEMVCDWTAMSQEYNQGQGGGSCKEYVDINLDKKWNFSATTKNLIYQAIEEIDYRNSVSARNRQPFNP